MDTIDLELVMSDMEMVDRRIDKAQKAAKGDKKFLHEAEVFQGLREWLDQGKSARGYLPRCRRMMPPSLPPASCSPSSR